MLREWKEPVRPGEEELKMRLAAAREKLAAQQLLIKEQKVPVLVLLEGWGTAGKGYCIGQIIENIDPRHFKVESMERKTGEEERKPFLYRHFTRIPEAGKFVFLDSGWMDEVVEERLHGELSEEKYAKRIESVRRFERQLTDNGYLVSPRKSRPDGWSASRMKRTPSGVWEKRICGRTVTTRSAWMRFLPI